MSDPAPPGPVSGTCLLVANPTSARGRGDEALAAVQRVLRGEGSRFQLRVHRTTGPRNAMRAAQLLTDDVDLVVAIGGDGTLHEVVEGLLRRGAEPERLPALGLIPVGTGNDYARMLDIPGRDPDAAARALVGGVARPVDVGRIEGAERGVEHFCNNVGLAFMADANAAHEETRILPGRLSYSWGGFLAYVRYRADALRVEVDGAAVQGRFMAVHVGIGRYCGGGICLTPDARLDDGELHVSLVMERGKLKGFLQWPRMAQGELLDDMSVLRGRRVRVEGPPGFLAHADGEVRRAQEGALTMTLLPRALRVVHRA